MSNVLRKLSNKEKVFLFEDYIASLNISFVARLIISINRSKLQDAVNYIAGKQPLLRSKISIDKDLGLVFESVPNLSIRVQEEQGEGKDILNIVRHHMEESFPIDTYPLFKVILFTDINDKTSTIILVVSHVIIDGISGRHLLNDLATLAIENNFGGYPNFSKIKSMDDLLLENVSYEEVATTGEKINFRENGGLSLKNGSPYLPGLLKTYNDRKLSLFQIIVPKETFRKLISITKSRGCSINSFLCALHMLAIYDEFETTEEIPVSFNIPVSMRERMIPHIDERYIGLYVSYIVINEVAGPDNHILTKSIDIYKKIKNALQEKEYIAGNKRVDHVFRLPSEQELRRFQFLLELTEPHIIVSNLGAGNENKCDALQKEQYIFLGARNGRRNWLSTVVNSFNDELFLNLSFNTNAIHIDRAKNIVSNIKNLLKFRTPKYTK